MAGNAHFESYQGQEPLRVVLSLSVDELEDDSEEDPRAYKNEIDEEVHAEGTLAFLLGFFLVHCLTNINDIQ